MTTTQSNALAGGTERARPTVFPDFVPSPGESHPIQRFQDYAETLDPLLGDLQRNLTDREIELRDGLSPLFLLDFSELHYLWSSTQTLRGRIGSIDFQSMLIDTVLKLGNLDLILPPGAVCEILAQLGRDLGKPVPSISSKLQKSLIDPIKGITKLPDIAEALREMPSEEELLKALEASSSLSKGEPYVRINNLIRSDRLRLLHQTEYAHDVAWDQASFAAALHILRRRPKSTFAANLWDAINIAVSSSLNSQTRRSGTVVYLVARGRRLAEAGRAVPGMGDSAIRLRGLAEAGLVRSPTYLYLYRRLVQPLSFDRLMTLGDMVSDLAQLRRGYALLSSPLRPHRSAEVGVTSAVAGPQQAHAQRDLVGRLESFRGKYSNLSRSLYTAWETYRQSARTTFLPFELFGAVEGDEATEEGARAAVVAFLKNAEEARGYISRLVEEGRASSLQNVDLSFNIHEEMVGSHRVVNTGIWATPSDQPVVLIDFVDDYFSATWHSSLTVHEFLDWVERFVIGMRLLSEEKSMATRERDLNWTYCTVVRTAEPDGLKRRGPTLETEATEDLSDGLDFPLSVEARAEIIQEFHQAEALRIYTPYGDLWINRAYDAEGRLRTGLISHIEAQAFLAALIGYSGADQLPIRNLFEVLDTLFGEYLKQPPTRDSAAGG